MQRMYVEKKSFLQFGNVRLHFLYYFHVSRVSGYFHGFRQTYTSVWTTSWRHCAQHPWVGRKSSGFIFPVLRTPIRMRSFKVCTFFGLFDVRIFLKELIEGDVPYLFSGVINDSAVINLLPPWALSEIHGPNG